MLIKEVEPIDKVGIDLLKRDDAVSVIDQIIELPLRKACRIFRAKGIETVMSSANKNNVLKPGEKPTEKEDVYGDGQQWYYPRPTYEDAGKGYAWIMINWDTLSDENKDLLFSLEQRKNKKGEKVGEKAIWFVRPDEMMDLFNTSGETDEKDAEFEKRHIVLSYNSGRYPGKTVFLRMPINEQITVEEVEEYFAEFAQTFITQVAEQEIKEPVVEEKEKEIEL